MPESRAVETRSNLQKTRKRFLLNLGLFTCLMAAVIYISRSQDSPSEVNESSPSPLQALSLIERANLEGQMLSLSEHPELMPAYETKSALAISKKAIERNSLFANTPASETEEFVSAFFEGYTSRLHDYYDSRNAHEAGFRFGLKYDPMFYPPRTQRNIYALLNNYKSIIVEKEGLDEASWRLYRRAFYLGFTEGYFQTDEDVTATAGESVDFDIE